MAWLFRLPRTLVGGAMVAAATALCRPALAQGCASCKTAAEASSNPGALNLAILVLLLPTLAIFGGIVYRAYRHR